jgi:triphosphatase
MTVTAGCTRLWPIRIAWSHYRMITEAELRCPPGKDPGSPAPTADHGARQAFSPGDPMIAFAYHCLRVELARLHGVRPDEHDVPSPGGVHRMRIAVRRIRAALRLFRELLPHGEARQLNKEFRWLARQLGEVRDLDVYNENLADYTGAIPSGDREQLAAYELHLRRERKHARVALGRLFTGERYRRLMQSFESFLQNGPSDAQLRRYASFTVRDGIPHYLKIGTERVLKRGAKITGKSPPEKLHRLRIHCKRLRYEIEFFRELRPEALAKPAKAAKRLQDFLGEYQDACTASERLAAYAQSLQREGGGVSELVPLGRLMQSQDARAAALRERFPKEWSRFRKAVSRNWNKRLTSN